MSQLDRLNDLIRTAERARDAASRDMLFASRAGMALVNSMYDLTEVDGLFDLSITVEREIKAIAAEGMGRAA